MTSQFKVATKFAKLLISDITCTWNSLRFSNCSQLKKEPASASQKCSTASSMILMVDFPLMAFVGSLKLHLKHFSALVLQKKVAVCLGSWVYAISSQIFTSYNIKYCLFFYSFCCQLKSDKALKVEAVKQLIGEEGSSASTQ